MDGGGGETWARPVWATADGDESDDGDWVPDGGSYAYSSSDHSEAEDVSDS